MTLNIGDVLLEFCLRDQSGKARTNKQLIGKKTLVLFFYPKDDTPGCTAEACGFRDKYDLFKIFGAEVWGVSCDNELSHRIFAEKNKLPYPLLYDEGGVLRKAFGVGKFLGLLDARATYIIDKTGVIRYIYKDLFNGPAHVNESLNILNEIA